LPLFSGVGRDMSSWPTAAHFISWLALCPDNDISAGKLLWSPKSQKPGRPFIPLGSGRLADSLALRLFVGMALDEYPPDHSTISRTRRRIDLDTHREVFGWVLGVLADRGLLKGQRIAIDATTLEAKAALRSMVRRDAGRELQGVSAGTGEASGIATPTHEDLARLDRKRKKRTSNKEWKSPADGDARRLSRRTVTTGSKNPVSQVKSC
jgi:hypothetical protein